VRDEQRQVADAAGRAKRRCLPSCGREALDDLESSSATKISSAGEIARRRSDGELASQPRFPLRSAAERPGTARRAAASNRRRLGARLGRQRRPEVEVHRTNAAPVFGTAPVR
jgi:hypothetical protein